MLHENIKSIRIAKGFSQEELANRLHVVRQTLSKWERGLSVPDSELLLSLAKILETPVSTLLGESISAPKTEDLQTIAEKLEEINLQLVQKKESKRKTIFWILLFLCFGIVLTFFVLQKLSSPYLYWNYQEPETAVLGVAFHALEWAFVRIAPFALLGLGIAIFIMKRKSRY